MTFLIIAQPRSARLTEYIVRRRRASNTPRSFDFAQRLRNHRAGSVRHTRASSCLQVEFLGPARVSLISSSLSILESDYLLQVLPHRYPFLLVDRIVEIEPGVRVTGLKNVSSDEAFFAGQEGRDAVMPGLLIIEAMAQTGAVLLMAGQDPPAARLVYFASLNDATWHGVVRPGDQLRISITVTHARGRLRKVHAFATVEDAVVCEADLAAVLVDKEIGSTL
jgi:beta-hydroxyacyl-ACP dehydratase FabZ